MGFYFILSLLQSALCQLNLAIQRCNKQIIQRCNKQIILIDRREEYLNSPTCWLIIRKGQQEMSKIDVMNDA